MLLPWILACATLAQISVEPIEALERRDPVELCRGREVGGQASLHVDRGRYRYFFDNEENERVFRADPERWEIQLGGSCARMGPGSGRGSPKRFWVHEGRIYVFASDPCLLAFQANPSLFLDPDDEPASGDDEARRRGRAALERALLAHGGAERIDGLRNFVQHDEWDESNGDTKTKRVEDLTVAFDGAMRRDEGWDDWSWSTVIHGTDAFAFGSNAAPEDLHASARREQERRLARHPLAILRARTRPDFVAVALPSENDELERVSVSFAGTTTTLGLARDSGRVVELAHRARGPRSNFGAVVRRASDFRDIGGLTLAFTESATFVGAAEPSETRTLERIEVNVSLAADRFTRPVKR